MKKFKSNKKQKKVVLPKIQKPSFFKKLEFLDPFHYVDLFVMPRIKKRTDSEIVETIVNILFALFFAGVIYFVLGVLFGTTSPIVVVYSGSMEPTFYRGDVMSITRMSASTPFEKEIQLNRNIKNVPVEKYLKPQYSGTQQRKLSKIIFENGQEVIPTTKGPVIIYTAYPSGLPIIHRAIVKIIANDGNFVLTKGDNEITNSTFDQDCGKMDNFGLSPTKNCITYYAVPLEKVQGKAFFKIPFVGCLKMWVFDDLTSLLTTGKLPRDFKGVC